MGLAEITSSFGWDVGARSNERRVDSLVIWKSVRVNCANLLNQEVEILEDAGELCKACSSQLKRWNDFFGDPGKFAMDFFEPFRDFRQNFLDFWILNSCLKRGYIVLNRINLQHNFPATAGNLVP